MDELAKIAKNGKSNIFELIERPLKLNVKECVEYQCRRRASTLDIEHDLIRRSYILIYYV